MTDDLDLGIEKPAEPRTATSYEVNAATVQALDAVTALIGDLRRLVTLAIAVVNEERHGKAK